ncbi:Rossmann-like domain-containing protein [Natronorubrum sulfidifaciens]|uniref:Putative heavy-metal chelation domain-containing protein n=1 Tax=Natronorubrum sulfidifaciens JCM 14089 TaxID=1230460 RepID=L9W358_9EURY|nr:DUF364 domain-containing protein [Natronorubrum sulfidifaciens]ELY43875.1 hypothetical protein C495_12460 [Natronorubrum sulfidifaciens JCM 14089]
MSAPILPTVVDRLRERGATDEATVAQITIGRSTLMVELAGVDGRADDGEREKRRTAGLAHRPLGDEPSTADLDLETLLEWATQPPADSMPDRDAGSMSDATTLEVALGVAAVNALSVPFLEWQTGDPMALLDSDVDTIATVGLFRPAFRKFSGVDVRVVERKPVGDVSTPDGVTVTTYRPADAAAAMAGAEVVFITGSTFVYGGLEQYLEAAPETATVVVIGATASMLPEPAFTAGVTVVAGASVTDPSRVREAIRADACGTELHEAGVEKVYTVTDRPTGVGRRLQLSRADSPDRDEPNDDRSKRPNR